MRCPARHKHHTNLVAERVAALEAVLGKSISQVFDQVLGWGAGAAQRTASKVLSAGVGRSSADAKDMQVRAAGIGDATEKLETKAPSAGASWYPPVRLSTSLPWARDQFAAATRKQCARPTQAFGLN